MGENNPLLPGGCTRDSLHRSEESGPSGPKVSLFLHEVYNSHHLKVGLERVVCGLRLGIVQMTKSEGSGGDALSWLRPCSPGCLIWGCGRGFPRVKLSCETQ